MRTIILFLAAASAAFGQLDSDVVTITATRQLNIQPDQVSLTVYMITDPGQTLDNVLAALQGTKITAADLSNVTAPINTRWQWVFTPTISFSALNTTTAALGALPANGPIYLQAFFLNASESPEAVASQPCPYPALINDAQTQAGKLGAAAGLTVGPILHLAPGSTQSLYANSYGYFVSVEAIYDPATGQANLISGSSGCTLTVQFKLGR